MLSPTVPCHACPTGGQVERLFYLFLGLLSSCLVSVAVWTRPDLLALGRGLLMLEPAPAVQAGEFSTLVRGA
eukprot:SAG22_NODE_3138_length_1908_cov_2.613046_2_plen_72_part_00